MNFCNKKQLQKTATKKQQQKTATKKQQKQLFVMSFFIIKKEKREKERKERERERMSEHIDKKRKLVGAANFVRHNPMTDKFPVKSFDHIEYYCGDG